MASSAAGAHFVQHRGTPARASASGLRRPPGRADDVDRLMSLLFIMPRDSVGISRPPSKGIAMHELSIPIRSQAVQPLQHTGAAPENCRWSTYRPGRRRPDGRIERFEAQCRQSGASAARPRAGGMGLDDFVKGTSFSPGATTRHSRAVRDEALHAAPRLTLLFVAGLPPRLC